MTIFGSVDVMFGNFEMATLRGLVSACRCVLVCLCVTNHWQRFRVGFEWQRGRIAERDAVAYADSFVCFSVRCQRFRCYAVVKVDHVDGGNGLWAAGGRRRAARRRTGAPRRL